MGGRVDRDGRGDVARGEQLLSDEAAEGMSDHDGLGLVLTAGVDDLHIVVDDVLDSDVVEGVGVVTRLGDGVAITGPARGGRYRIPAFGEQVQPRLPGGGVDPQTVDEDDGIEFGAHKSLRGLQGGDIATVDAEVGTGDVGRAVTGEEEREVGDFLRGGEASGGRTGDHGVDDLVGGGPPLAAANCAAIPP